MDLDLERYFYSGRPYKVILDRLYVVHGLKKSMSWLKRKFLKMGLKKRSVSEAPREYIKRLIQVMLDSPNCLRGYRSVWRILRRKYELPVKRNTVMELLREVDPEGVARRKGKRLRRRTYHCKGPNFIWHLDGNDKLSPFGLCIHGCIDGFSRKILWLKVASTNHNPSVIARYYLECLENVCGCPKILRSDMGTENSGIAKIHIAFRMDHADSVAGAKSFIFGPSTANTRIESWWAILRKFKLDWWIHECKTLQAEGYFNKCDDIHRYILGYIFGSLLSKDLESFAKEWNEHPIRKNRHSVSPHGCPNDIYDMPTLFGSSDQLQSVDTTLWAYCMVHESSEPAVLCPLHFKDVCDQVLDDVLGLSIQDVTHKNCRNIYLQLVGHMKRLVQNGQLWVPAVTF